MSRPTTVVIHHCDGTTSTFQDQYRWVAKSRIKALIKQYPFARYEETRPSANSIKAEIWIEAP